MAEKNTVVVDDRWLALKGLRAVLERQQTLDQVEQQQALTPLARELLFGSCRFYLALAHTIDSRLQKPLRHKDRDLTSLLVLGAYQVLHTRIPSHAAVNSTVALTHKLKKPWAKGLVNGVLRGLLREPVTEPQAATTNYPSWLVEALTADYPQQSTALLEANNERAPMSLRVNTQRTTVEQIQQQLNQAGLDFRQGYQDETLILANPIPIERLPGYREGLVSVQDAGAQLAAACWSSQRLPAGARLLDACAAPGGKLHHALARLQPSDFVALEVVPKRLEALRQEAQRLGYTDQLACYQQGDATERQWWDGKGFDRILLDAPCTGTGTLRRHPDIKLLPAQNQHSAKQLALLNNLWGLLHDGGELLYCTCSLLNIENDDVIATFMTANPDAQLGKLELPTGAATKQGWQLTPLDPATDGFYYARLIKAASQPRRGTNGEQA